MPNLFLNDLTITAEGPILDQIRLSVSADTRWIATPENDSRELQKQGDRLRYLFLTIDRQALESVDALARRFPDAHLLLKFENHSESIFGFVEYASGMEPRGKVFEDCGGL